MRILAALAILFASCVLARDPGHKWAKAVSKKIRSQNPANKGGPAAGIDFTNATTINWKDAPMTQFIQDPIREGFDHLRRILVPGPKHHVSVFATRKLQQTYKNRLDKPHWISLANSKLDIQKSKDWSMYANLVAGGADGGRLEISKGDADKMATPAEVDVSERFECPPKSTCRFVTVTLHATLTGFCRRRPSLRCKNQETDHDVCHRLRMVPSHNELERPIKFHDSDSCAQYDEFVWKNCYAKAADRCLGATSEDCTVTAPIFYNGKPLSVVVGHARPFGKKGSKKGKATGRKEAGSV